MARKNINITLYAGLEIKGVENHIYFQNNWYEFFSELDKDYKVNVIAPVNPNTKLESFKYKKLVKNLKLIPLKTFHSRWINFYLNFNFIELITLRIIRQLSKSDIILLRVPSPGHLLILLTCLILRKKTVIFICGSTHKQNRYILSSNKLTKIFLNFHYQIHKIVYRYTSLQFCYNHELKSQFKCQRSFPWFTPLQLPIQFRKNVSVITELRNLRILRVAKYEPSKNLGELITLLSKIQENSNYNLSLTICGEVKCHKYLNHIKKVVKIYKNIKVELKTNLSPNDLFHFYKNSDFQIINSAFEGFPRIILEGASVGLPLIVDKNFLNISPEVKPYCSELETFKEKLCISDSRQFISYYNNLISRSLTFAEQNNIKNKIYRFNKIINSLILQ